MDRSTASGRDQLARPRRRMVERLAAALGVTDARVLEALAAVPRHALVPEALRSKLAARVVSIERLPGLAARARSGAFVRERLGRCRFVDLVGSHGWAS